MKKLILLIPMRAKRAMTQGVIAASILFTHAFAQVASTTSGNWSNTATWGGAPVPVATDNVRISDAHTVTVDISTAVCDTLEIGEGGTGAVLKFNTGSHLISSGITSLWSGTIDMTNGGIFSVGGLGLMLGAYFTYGTGKVIFTRSAFVPNNAQFDFYDLEITGAGTTVVTLSRNTTVYRDLVMTSGYCNLNGKILTLGSSGVASTLTRTASTITNWMYGGTFKCYWLASTAISSTDAASYGLFPMGIGASSYRPVEINSTVNPTTGGYFTVDHINATGTLDLNPVYNDAGTNIVRIHNAQFMIGISGVTGGTYNIDVTMTGLPLIGNISDIRLVKWTSTIVNAPGTHAATTGTTTNPTAKRTGLNTVDFTGNFRISTTNSAVTPLGGPVSVELIDFNTFQENNIISIYPNPSSGAFAIQVNSKQSAVNKMEVEIYNVLGECIHQHISTSAHFQIDLSSQPSGVYFLQVKTEKESFPQKLIIQK